MFNFKNRTVHAKTVEPKTTLKKYYGIGSNNQVLDYEGKTRSEAQGFFEMEFASMGSELEYLGSYSR
ncbi:hypothetical protein EDM57_04390 [Brevibacillus gelatini]|uniref:Uncharacterized protein n=1 Tax=Brevibacillus gelatini TaxID=1655277 RepID=A0A3M8B8S1_9BACL|nr:hypothetical protein [Brevibacillus gelatini]RNB59387.1 hypothetical protein EDM57_04390 [Brevibacillus gelatini]